MKFIKIALFITLIAGLNAGAAESVKTNCQAKLDGSLEKNKAVKTQEAQATVFGNAQGAPKKATESPKTTH